MLNLPSSKDRDPGNARPAGGTIQVAKGRRRRGRAATVRESLTSMWLTARSASAASLFPLGHGHAARVSGGEHDGNWPPGRTSALATASARHVALARRASSQLRVPPRPGLAVDLGMYGLFEGHAVALACALEETVDYGRRRGAQQRALAVVVDQVVEGSPRLRSASPSMTAERTLAISSMVMPGRNCSPRLCSSAA